MKEETALNLLEKAIQLTMPINQYSQDEIKKRFDSSLNMVCLSYWKVMESANVSSDDRKKLFEE